VKVRAQPHGEIDYGHLEACLRRNRDVPALLVASIGTTMTEARDDVGAMLWACDALGLERRRLHSDAALCGAYAPFLEPRPSFDFEDGADSVAVSGGPRGAGSQGLRRAGAGKSRFAPASPPLCPWGLPRPGGRA
jgi:glutamate/tyrosine decarboxylase-like PLP-dependent enzyme